ncbi:MAG: lytic murein transglycosylase [Gemmatimonadota bacterium]
MTGGLLQAALLLGFAIEQVDARPEPVKAPCLETVRRAALASGITEATWFAATDGFTPDSSVLAADRRQPEFTLPIWDYLAVLVDSERVADGVARLAAWDSVLTGIEAKTGVERNVLVAIWGVESDYGRAMGQRPLIRSLLTGACFGRRPRLFKEQLIAALKIVDRNEIPLDRLVGSWAGAFGQTQFMPTTYLALAADGDGDGRRDVIGSVPDALASAARYLKRAGWAAGERWGFEVRVPKAYRGPAGRRATESLARWSTLGITRVDREPLAGSTKAALLRPAGPAGPAFLVLRNFTAIFRYNAAESYALAIGHLADRLAGGAEFVTPWPTDDRGLSRAERREVQERLTKVGFDPGRADGSLGAKTRAAIADYERRHGLPVTSRPGGLLLERLRAELP